MRRGEEYVGKRLMRRDVEGRRRKGRPKWRWMDCVNVDLREKEMLEKGISGEERQLVRNIKVGKEVVE